jgi:hypothetical protein
LDWKGERGGRTERKGKEDLTGKIGGKQRLFHAFPPSIFKCTLNAVSLPPLFILIPANTPANCVFLLNLLSASANAPLLPISASAKKVQMGKYAPVPPSCGNITLKAAFPAFTLPWTLKSESLKSRGILSDFCKPGKQGRVRFDYPQSYKERPVAD